MKLSRQAEVAASEIYHLIESGDANLAEGTPIGDIVQRAMNAGYREGYNELYEARKEVEDYLWPKQTGMPNKHRNMLVAIQMREQLLREQLRGAEIREKSLREAHGGAIVAQSQSVDRAEEAEEKLRAVTEERDEAITKRDEALAWLENKSPDLTYESIVASLEKTEEQREELIAELFKARQELTFLRTKLAIEPRRLCGGCGFLLGVSRKCLTEGCGSDYSNDPRAFAQLEID